MQRKKTLTETLHETFHRNKKKPYEIAEEMGQSYNHMARMVLDTDSGCNFPERLLVPLMKTTKNYSYLVRLNEICGFLPPVKYPKGIKKFKDQDRQVNDYQKDFAETITTLLDFINNPTSEKYKSLNSKLLNHMSETEYWRKRCEKGLINQTELFNGAENE